jgi:hypothetical protein
VIKASVRCATSTVDLVPQSLRCSFVDLIATRDVVHVEEGMSEADVIDRIAVIVEQDIAVKAGVKHNVGMLFDVRNILVIVSAIVGEFHTGQQCRDIVCMRWTDAVLDLGVGHPGQVARLSMERAW